MFLASGVAFWAFGVRRLRAELKLEALRTVHETEGLKLHQEDEQATNKKQRNDNHQQIEPPAHAFYLPKSNNENALPSMEIVWFRPATTTSSALWIEDPVF